MADERAERERLAARLSAIAERFDPYREASDQMILVDAADVRMLRAAAAALLRAPASGEVEDPTRISTRGATLEEVRAVSLPDAARVFHSGRTAGVYLHAGDRVREWHFEFDGRGIYVTVVQRAALAPTPTEDTSRE